MNFIFYEIEYLCLLSKVNSLLPLAIEDGNSFLVPSLQLSCYGSVTIDTVQKNHSLGQMQIIEINDYEVFFSKYRNTSIGKGFLYLLYSCLEENAFLVIDEKELGLIEFAKNAGVKTISISDFTLKIIKNQSHSTFLMNVKDSLIKLDS